MTAHPSFVVEDQSAVIAALEKRLAPAKRIDTHGAVVFLSGDRAYKLKRAVKFPYMDFSTAERRRTMCEAEVEINRRLAPEIYLGVEPVENDWVVVMRRFDEDGLLDRMAERGQLTLHADRGTSMSSKPVAFLLADLGVTKTHSRPHVSNDNPYSESQFRTMKYRPEFPDRFGCIQDSRAFCQGFFRWYNEEHRHSSLALLTPAMVHYGQSALILEQRQIVLDRAYRTHPERFVGRTPRPAAVPTEVWINKPPNLENKTQ